MNYELAKQLKDAGFPQLQYDGQGKIYPLRESNGDYSQSGTVYLPTLSELIEACGDLEITILGNPELKYWKVTCLDKKTKSLIETDFYVSLDDVFANLWLELNK